MVNIADPDSAFVVSFLPNDGVGLARIEFIVSNTIQIHPMALVKLEESPKAIQDPQIIDKIAYITRAYQNKKQFFVDNLAYGISTIASAFYPKLVIVRLSDFKTNEYRNLIGGVYFEPEEENPMIGWRGASRYYHENYKPAFALECQAIKKARALKQSDWPDKLRGGSKKPEPVPEFSILRGRCADLARKIGIAPGVLAPKAALEVIVRAQPETRGDRVRGHVWQRSGGNQRCQYRDRPARGGSKPLQSMGGRWGGGLG